MRKVNYPISKFDWHPSLIPGAIVLISTYNSRGEPNIAPKSWIQMVSFEPPMLMFSGTKGNTTETNILQTNCFGVNFVDSSMASTVYGCTRWYGQERIAKTGFALAEAARINAPLVDDCKANIECRLHSTKELGSGFVVFGEIVTASIWEEVLRVERDRRYQLLDQVVFLEDGMFAPVTHASRV